MILFSISLFKLKKIKIITFKSELFTKYRLVITPFKSIILKSRIKCYAKV